MYRRYEALRLCTLPMLPSVSLIIAIRHAGVSVSMTTGIPRSFTAATVTSARMLTNVSDHANAMCELYRTTRPSATQLEALLAVSTDGTGAQACDFDPSVTMPDFTKLSRDEARRLLSAGYTVRRLLGTHPLETSRCFPGASEPAWNLSRV